MVQSCKGSCNKLKAGKHDYRSFREAGGRYQQGFKRCSVCYIYLKWEGNFCPCCGAKLSTRPSDTKLKNIQHLYVY